jgi:hypothetical protein
MIETREFRRSPSLIAATHNLLKLWRAGVARAQTAKPIAA